MCVCGGAGKRSRGGAGGAGGAVGEGVGEAGPAILWEERWGGGIRGGGVTAGEDEGGHRGGGGYNPTSAQSCSRKHSHQHSHMQGYSKQYCIKIMILSLPMRN